MRSAGLDADATAFLAERCWRTAHEFGLDPVDCVMPELEWGERPEFRAGTADSRPRIRVAADGADWWRIRYQIAHEVFHWLCTPPETFHWTQELFAVEMAVHAMQELGEHDYAERSMATLAQGAERLPLAAMLTTHFRETYLDGLYGRAWLTGRQLTGTIGWELLKPLAHSFDEHGAPDVVGWIRALARSEQEAVETVLGTPAPDWV